ncbi:Uncharacterised protein [Vibrio cholerae]|nr:Uncharacterised protein [Vibrio cholerae]CSA52998.1 Uncharacterised protein [Vibrio cholerae]CSB61917.1 Uncharacterised protein [Vibrio cholerae]
MIVKKELDVIERSLRNIVQCIFGQKGLVTSEQHVMTSRKAAEYVIDDHIVGLVLEEQIFLIVIHIQA